GPPAESTSGDRARVAGSTCAAGVGFAGPGSSILGVRPEHAQMLMGRPFEEDRAFGRSLGEAELAEIGYQRRGCILDTRLQTGYYPIVDVFDDLGSDCPASGIGR